MKNQYNIKVNPPELTSEQIKKHQDFDTLFAKFEQQASPADETPIRAIESTATKTSPAWLVKYGTSALIAIAASVVLVFMLKEVAFFDSKPNDQISEVFSLQAPLPSFDLAYGDLVVKNASVGETLLYKSGSQIIVPPAAFIDEQGVPVMGAVQIKYREFNDHIDMFLAGVPKEIDQHQNLQSVGMMEIKGFQDGKPVFLAQDKTLDVALHGSAIEGLPTADLDVFVYSNQQDAWQFKSKDDVELLENKEKLEKVGLSPDDSFYETAKTALAASMPTAPLKVGVPDNMVLFNFDINIEEFPSLAKYDENIHFLAKEDKDGDLIYDYEWNSMDIEPLGPHEYTLTLIRTENNENIEHKVKIWPAIKATELSQKIYEEQMQQYNTQLKQWELDVVAAAEQLQKNTSTVADMASRKIINRFTINRFGIWNCGKIMELKTEQPVLASYVDKQGSEISIKQIFVSDKNQQLYYSVNNTDKIHALRMNISESSKMWAITEDNQFWVVHESIAEPGQLKYQLESAGTLENQEAIRKLLTF